MPAYLSVDETRLHAFVSWHIAAPPNFFVFFRAVTTIRRSSKPLVDIAAHIIF